MRYATSVRSIIVSFPAWLQMCAWTATRDWFTFSNGKTVRELIVDIDDSARRLAYAPVGAFAKHHHASMQVFAQGENSSRLVWITDVLPDEVVTLIRPLIDQGSAIMKKTLEANMAA